MLSFDAGMAFAPVDSARVVSHVYSVSLLALVPLGAAAAAALLVRRAPAGTRALLWRAAVLALLALYVTQLLPSRWEAWVVPSVLAEPLIALGRVMVSSGGPLVGAPAAGAADVLLVSRILAAVYWAGCGLALVPLLRGFAATRRLGRGARPIADPATRTMFEAARADLGVRRRVSLLVHDEVTVPITFGVLNPRVLLPAGAARWEPAHLQATLLHELAHVRAGDVAYAIAGHFARALFWFHPGVWFIDRRLREECELAADDRVLAAGVRPSDYGTLLVAVVDRVHATPRPACALAAASGLRRRLALVLQPARELRAPSRLTTRTTLAATLVGAIAIGAVELAPTRGVLHGLMHDNRWESRAYAVIGLAPRPDSLVVTRAAAAGDPSPQVRAWATYALARHAGDPLEARSLNR